MLTERLPHERQIKNFLTPDTICQGSLLYWGSHAERGDKLLLLQQCCVPWLSSITNHPWVAKAFYQRATALSLHSL